MSRARNQVNNSQTNYSPLSVYQVRLNDYQIHINSTKPLTVEYKEFDKTNAPRYGGIRNVEFGAHTRKGKKGVYYLAQHKPEEYFALEILNKLGINTPSARIISTQFYPGTSYGYVQHLISTRSIDNYIPLAAIRNPMSDLEPKLQGIRKKYELDIKRQVVKDLEEGREYKISGNLFTSDMAAKLVIDEDFQPDGMNLGLVRVGNRFYACAIDKDQVNFNGKSYEDICKGKDERLADEHCVDARVLNDPLYKSQNSEQVLAMLYDIQQALTLDESQLCDFDRIFDNPRVRLSASLTDKDKNKDACANFKKTANSMLDHYKKELKLEDNYLQEFSKREAIRMAIADKIVSGLDVKESLAENLKKLIIEDLRGPYYQCHFLDKEKFIISSKDEENKTLFDAILNDIKNEFNVKEKVRNSKEAPEIKKDLLEKKAPQEQSTVLIAKSFNYSSAKDMLKTVSASTIQAHASDQISVSKKNANREIIHKQNNQPSQEMTKVLPNLGRQKK